MARPTGHTPWFIAILLVAAALRLTGVAWDGGIGAHPDERYLVGVAEGMARLREPNPFAVDASFPYGHVPLYLFLRLGGTDRLMAARLLTGLLDVGTVALTAALARVLLAAGRLGRWSGAPLMAALFLAVMPLHVQQAHFATADVPLAFFSAGALLFAARSAPRLRFAPSLTTNAVRSQARSAAECRQRDSASLRRLLRTARSQARSAAECRQRDSASLRRLLRTARSQARSAAECRLAGIWAGLALGCKAGAALLLIPIALAGALGAKNRRERIRRVAGALGVALATFALTDPFAVLESPRFLTNVAAQAALARGAVLVPYTLQYRGTPPYLYPIAQQLLWGMGPVLGLLGFGGLAWTAVRAARGRLRSAEWVVLVWALPFFAFTGGLSVKFPRYLLPLTPVLAVYAVQWVIAIGRGATRILFALAVLPAAFLSTALVVSYGQPHPWVAASEWIRAHIPPGSVIAVEEWDHPLPLDAEGYTLRVLPVFAPEGEEKERRMASVLAEADAVVVASRRGYGALARWPDRFPATLADYRALFAGERGWIAAGCWGRWPSLARISLADDPFGAAGLPLPHPACRPTGAWLRLPRLDESFVVYDHPEVVIFVAARGGR